MRLDGLRMLAGRPDRPITLGEFADEAARYLQALRPLHPLLRGTMYLMGPAPEEVEPLAPDLSNVLSHLQRFGWSRSAPEGWNTGLMSDKSMGAAGTARSGFHLWLNTNGGPKAGPETLSLRLHGGGRAGGLWTLDMEFPSEGAPEFGHLDFVKRLMQITVECWQPESVKVLDVSFRRALQALTQSERLFMGWVQYFDCRDCESVLPLDIHREPFGPQGLLTVLQPTPPDIDDTAALERARRMYEALRPGQHLIYRQERKPIAATPTGSPPQ